MEHLSHTTGDVHYQEFLDTEERLLQIHRDDVANGRPSSAVDDLTAHYYANMPFFYKSRATSGEERG